MEVVQQAHGKAGLLGVLLLVGDRLEARVTRVLIKIVIKTKACFKCTAGGAHRSDNCPTMNLNHGRVGFVGGSRMCVDGCGANDSP